MSIFTGFDEPKENYSKLPNELIDQLNRITTLAELKVILYVLRHTWGYHESERKITMDELQSGRKKRDGSRIDKGTGMSKTSIRDGINRAIDHGFLSVSVDDRDAARVRKYYSINSRGSETVPRKKSGGQKLTPGEQKLTPGGSETVPRTEKDNLERKLEKERLTPSEKEEIANALFAELVSLLNQPVKLMTINMKREYENFIYDLFDLETPPKIGDIEHFGKWWYVVDWRGKQGQKPTLHQIRQHWADAAGWDAEQAAKDSEVVAIY